MRGTTAENDYIDFYQLMIEIIDFEFDDWFHSNGKDHSFYGLIASCKDEIVNANVFWKEGRNEIHIAILSP